MATIKPLEGKYYGTIVVLTKPGSERSDDEHELVIWCPDHYAKPFASSREVQAGWGPSDGHDHVEDVQSFAIANIVAKALTEAGY